MLLKINNTYLTNDIEKDLDFDNLKLGDQIITFGEADIGSHYDKTSIQTNINMIVVENINHLIVLDGLEIYPTGNVKTNRSESLGRFTDDVSVINNNHGMIFLKLNNNIVKLYEDENVFGQIAFANTRRIGNNHYSDAIKHRIYEDLFCYETDEEKENNLKNAFIKNTKRFTLDEDNDYHGESDYLYSYIAIHPDNKDKIDDEDYLLVFLIIHVLNVKDRIWKNEKTCFFMDANGKIIDLEYFFSEVYDFAIDNGFNQLKWRFDDSINVADTTMLSYLKSTTDERLMKRNRVWHEFKDLLVHGVTDKFFQPYQCSSKTGLSLYISYDRNCRDAIFFLNEEVVSEKDLLLINEETKYDYLRLKMIYEFDIRQNKKNGIDPFTGKFYYNGVQKHIDDPQYYLDYGGIFDTRVQHVVRKRDIYIRDGISFVKVDNDSKLFATQIEELFQRMNIIKTMESWA